MQTDVTKKVIEGLEANGFVTTAGLANWIGCGRDKIIDAYDQIEAAGLKLMRVRGIGGGAQFVGKRMRKLDCLHIETVAEDGAPATLLSASA